MDRQQIFLSYLSAYREHVVISLSRIIWFNISYDSYDCMIQSSIHQQIIRYQIILYNLILYDMIIILSVKIMIGIIQLYINH